MATSLRNLAILALAGISTVAVADDKVSTGNATADNDALQTWWHPTGEINFKTAVREENVRQSHVYSTWVKSTTEMNDTYFNSFVYESIARNGMGKASSPTNLSAIGEDYDSVTVEEAIWMTMAWTQFLYSSDAWVRISRHGDNPSNSSNVVVRPTNLGLTVTDDGEGNVYVLVPHTKSGLRFSVEFKDNLYEYRNGCPGTDCDSVQDWFEDEDNYYSPLTDDRNPVMSVEPHDSLLVFASPFPSEEEEEDLVPAFGGEDTYAVSPGLVNTDHLASIGESTVYFPPGAYWMTGTSHLSVSPAVSWVYLAPGAYVKGAVQFNTTAAQVRATGFGVLSGEQYVYQANKLLGYENTKSNDDCLRMWEGWSYDGTVQTFLLHGVTTANPSFNSIDWRGDLDSIVVEQRDYKQVGAWFEQTDGTTLYTGSSVRDTFYHSNDDTIKTYGSDIDVRDVVVWKGKTAPIVQLGWFSRNMNNVTVDGVDVVHSRWTSNGSHPSIIGANQIYMIDEDDTTTAHVDRTVQDIYFGNIRAEGISGNLFRICPLANYRNFTIENIWLEEQSRRENGIFRSELPVWGDEDGNEVTIRGFTVRDFYVGDEKIEMGKGNWGPNDLGGLNIPDEFLDGGVVVDVLPFHGRRDTATPAMHEGQLGSIIVTFCSIPRSSQLTVTANHRQLRLRELNKQPRLFARSASPPLPESTPWKFYTKNTMDDNLPHLINDACSASGLLGSTPDNANPDNLTHLSPLPQKRSSTISQKLELHKRRKTLQERPATRADFEVAIFCALPLEASAVLAQFDYRWDGNGPPFDKAPSDANAYTTGSIGRHNVVLVHIPNMGKGSAAVAAADCLHSFQSIRLALLVGICGGVPQDSNGEEILLGDVVISDGVVQYDLGRRLADRLVRKQTIEESLERQSSEIRGLLAKMKSDKTEIQETVADTLRSAAHPVRSPGRDKDKLFKAAYRHKHQYLTCYVCAACSSRSDPACEEAIHSSCAELGCHNEELISRRHIAAREDRLFSPVVHIGRFASGDSVMRSSEDRDEIAKSEFVIAFEMEAAGIWQRFPGNAVVIKGVCDYSDSHKNKSWQAYAASTAAAGMRVFLDHFTPAVPLPSDDRQLLSRSSTIQFTENQAQRKRDMMLESLNFDQIDARQLGIENAHTETLEWLHETPEYVDWLDPDRKSNDRHRLLWIKGKPGSGKSTLMKFILNKAKDSMKGSIIISFFFHARGDDLQRSTIGMYRSLLLQLFQKEPALQHVFDTIETFSRGHVTWTIQALKHVFAQALKSLRCSVACFVDALDECDEDAVRDMVLFLEHGCKLVPDPHTFRVCFSSRHYPYINIGAGVELVLDTQDGHISDIVQYVDSMLRIGDDPEARDIKQEVHTKSAGIFMWVVLVVRILNKEYDRGRTSALRARLQDIPSDLHALFRDILTRDRSGQHQLLLCLQWVLFARHPLKPEQLLSVIILDTESEAMPSSVARKYDVRRFLLDCSKGLVEVTRSRTKPTAQFIHESVRDFFLKENGLDILWSEANQTLQGWNHDRLKQSCLKYMRMVESSGVLPKESPDRLPKATANKFPFLEYAVGNVLFHADRAEEGGISQATFIHEFPRRSWIRLRNLLERYPVRRHTPNASMLYLLAEFGCPHLVRICKPSSSSMLLPGEERYGPPFFAALAVGGAETTRSFLESGLEHSDVAPLFRQKYEQAIQIGLEIGSLGQTFEFSKLTSLECLMTQCNPVIFEFVIQMEMRNSGYTPGLYQQHGSKSRSSHSMLLAPTLFLSDGPLVMAAAYGDYDGMEKILADEKFSGRNIVDGSGNTPLLLAVSHCNRSTVQVRLLKLKELEVNVGNFDKETPLMVAARRGHEGIVSDLLGVKDIDPNIPDGTGTTPLMAAVEKGHRGVIFILLNAERVDPSLSDEMGRTTLLLAIEKGNEAVVFRLLSLAKKNYIGHQTLNAAIRMGSEYVVSRLLVESKINPESIQPGIEHLVAAIKVGDEKTVSKLLEHRSINPNSPWLDGHTPLSLAVEMGDKKIVSRLLKHKGIDPTILGKHGRTLLSTAVGMGDKKMVSILLEDRRINPNSPGVDGHTALWQAIQQGREEVALKLLEDEKVDPTIGDSSGNTPLVVAIQCREERVVSRLLKHRRAKRNVSGHEVRTSLEPSADSGRENFLSPLLEHQNVSSIVGDCWGVESTFFDLLNLELIGPNLQDKGGRSALSWASERGDAGAIEQLLRRGECDANLEDNIGWSPLHYAAAAGQCIAVGLFQTWGGGDVDFDREASGGSTPLSLAAGWDRHNVVEKLVETGKVDVNSKDADGNTPLLKAIYRGHLETVKCLLHWSQVDVNSQNDEGQTPLMVALGHFFGATPKKFVRCLMQTGKIDLTLRDEGGDTALGIAMSMGLKDCVEMILEAGGTE
ncbi:NB-ARC and ankyrin domain protein [Zalerion maritima]|uniref:NB-ARC and ankyrin domain protein n=1 Tax=Zalerion maritima TaxID=339359 RepID=A0AAD5RSK3_9PEZI|nr:NB-ARC and ankyrin domain protein [Zalerion maritima]